MNRKERNRHEYPETKEVRSRGKARNRVYQRQKDWSAGYRLSKRKGRSTSREKETNKSRAQPVET